MKTMEEIRITRKILNEEDIICLINSSKSKRLIESIELSYYEGLKIADIVKKISIPRRTLQGKLSRLGEKVLGIKINFEQLRQSCMIRLLNQGYTPEYIINLMGYSRKDYLLYKRRVAGYISPKLRYETFKRDGFKCKICGDKERLHVDHIVPVVNGGESIKENLQTLCRECNIGKGKNE